MNDPNFVLRKGSQSSKCSCDQSGISYLVQWSAVQTIGAFLGDDPNKRPRTLQRYCREVLSKLDPKQVASDLEGCVLLCHEKDSTHCHRRIVAEWLEAALGFNVPEMDYAVKKMPSLWDFEKKEEQADDKIEISTVDNVPWEDSVLKADRPVDSGNITLKAIHPSPVVEFAPLISNLYRDCSHDCWYCYNKLINRGQNLSYHTPTKKASLANIQDDLLFLQRNGRNNELVLISNMGDPYDMGRKGDIKPKGLKRYFSEEKQDATPDDSNSYIYTREVLETFREFNHTFAILTKGNMLTAAKDFDLYGPSDWFGVTLTYDNDTDSKKYEPGAASPTDRIKALEEAHNRDPRIQTWVSMEPVLDPDQTLNLIELIAEFVDHFRVGKLNHFKEIEAKIDWPKFRNDVVALMQKCGKEPCSDETGKGYKLKHQFDAI
jgi:DNA repair photolyase